MVILLLPQRAAARLEGDDSEALLASSGDLPLAAIGRIMRLWWPR